MTTITHHAEIPSYPMTRAARCPLDPPPQQQSLLVQGQRLSKVRTPTGDIAWLVTGHATQRALLADPRISADPTRPGFPHDTPERRAAVELGSGLGSFAEMDDPEHARLRRMVSGSFTVKRCGRCNRSCSARRTT